MLINFRDMTLSIPKQKHRKYKGDVLGSYQEPKNNSIAVDKSFRSFNFINLGSSSCQATLLVFASGTNKYIPVEFFQSNIFIRFACSRRTTVVDEQYQFINRQITDSATTTINDYSDRCI